MRNVIKKRENKNKHRIENLINIGSENSSTPLIKFQLYFKDSLEENSSYDNVKLKLGEFKIDYRE